MKKLLLQLTLSGGLCLVFYSTLVHIARAQAELTLAQTAEGVQIIPITSNSTHPFFRATLQVGQGKIPADANLKEPVVSVTEANGGKCKVFDTKPLSANATTEGAAEKQYILLLLDTSGSMFDKQNLVNGRLRFDAAEEAIRGMVSKLRPADRIAIVPFESHAVEARIKAVPFTGNRDEAFGQLEKIKAEKPVNLTKANTALFSATRWALLKLKEEKDKNGVRQAQLVVLTDGKNDVHKDRGDDPDLWEGIEGLREINELARKEKLPIWTIGLGDSYDETTLRQMVFPPQLAALHHFGVQETARLNAIFEQLPATFANQFQVSFLCDNHRTIGGLRELHFKLAVRLPNEKPVENVPLTWSSRDHATGVFDSDKRQPSEEKALDDLLRKESEVGIGAVDKITQQELVALFKLTLLLVIALSLLWFGAPRLIWPGMTLPGSGLLPTRFKRQAPKAVRRRAPGARPAVAAEPARAKPRQRFEETQTFEQWRDRK